MVLLQISQFRPSGYCPYPNLNFPSMWVLKTFHDKNWREIIHQIFPEFLQPLGISEYNGLPSSIVVSFLFGFWFLLAWVSSGCPDLTPTEFDTCTGEMSLSIRSFRSRV